MGFVAEEVGKVIPEIVDYEENGIDARGLDYGHMTPVLLQAIKEQQQQIEAQAGKIESLENAIGKLTARLDALEKE